MRLSRPKTICAFLRPTRSYPPDPEPHAASNAPSDHPSVAGDYCPSYGNDRRRAVIPGNGAAAYSGIARPENRNYTVPEHSRAAFNESSHADHY